MIAANHQFNNVQFNILPESTSRELSSIPVSYKKPTAEHPSLNELRRINKYLEAQNEKMVNEETTIFFLETMENRKKRLLERAHIVFTYPLYTIDFIFHRFFPKWKPTQQLYFNLTNGKNRVISLAEALGRIYSCGFTVLNTKEDKGITYIKTKKTGLPKFDLHPTYGPFIRLNRIGLHGKHLKVLKMRTMHPYSEYIQGYLYEKNQLAAGGKIENDFRITTWGKWMRALWIDELPMVWNMLKGELKIVGVRPLSLQYFNLYPKEMQQLRIQVKPGLIPPFYADLPSTLEEIIASEKRYIEAYQKNPFSTDVRYFFKAIYNIVIKNARSK